MSAEKMEVLLRRCRPPQPPAAVERRVLEAARGLRRPPSRLFALAAALLFGVIVVAVVRTDRPVSPGGKGQAIRKWTYTQKEQDQVTATFDADEGVLGDGVMLLRAVTAKLYPLKGETIVVRADAARFDQKGQTIEFQGAVRIGPVDGFSSASADLKNRTWFATMDLAARFAKATKSAPENYRPKIEIEAKSAFSVEGEYTFVEGALTLTSPGWKFRAATPRGRWDGWTFTLTGDFRATFEDGTVVQADEAVLGDSQRSLRLKGSFK